MSHRCGVVPVSRRDRRAIVLGEMSFLLPMDSEIIGGITGWLHERLSLVKEKESPAPYNSETRSQFSKDQKNGG